MYAGIERWRIGEQDWELPAGVPRPEVEVSLRAGSGWSAWVGLERVDDRGERDSLFWGQLYRSLDLMGLRWEADGLARLIPECIYGNVAILATVFDGPAGDVEPGSRVLIQANKMCRDMGLSGFEALGVGPRVWMIVYAEVLDRALVDWHESKQCLEPWAVGCLHSTGLLRRGAPKWWEPVSAYFHGHCVSLLGSHWRRFWADDRKSAEDWLRERLYAPGYQVDVNLAARRSWRQRLGFRVVARGYRQFFSCHARVVLRLDQLTKDRGGFSKHVDLRMREQLKAWRGLRN